MCTKNRTKIRTGVIVLFLFKIGWLFGQNPITIYPNTAEHIFKTAEVFYMEDSTNRLSFEEIKSAGRSQQFVPNERYYPKNFNRSSTYWFRVKIHFRQQLSGERVIELFDQTADLVEAFIPNGKGGFVHDQTGASIHFGNRHFMHKNFEFLIPALEKGTYEAYFKVRSRQMVNVILVYRTMERFVQYTLTEYFTFGLFYGMIILFSFNNLLMYFAVRGRQYLYYVLYILCVGLYEMSSDGIAFQYLWPENPWFNQYATAVFVCCVSVFALLFTKSLLHVKQKEPRLNKLLNAVIILRILFFVYCLCFNQNWFIYKFVEIVPLSVAFFSGIWLWRKKYRPARYFVLAYAFLFLGFVLKVIYVLGYARFLPSSIGHYSITFGFVMEMTFLSFAIRDKVRLLKNKKERAQKRVIEQMQINEKLHEMHNRDLEKKVKERTLEVMQKSEELVEKSEIITGQNRELKEMNNLLMAQSEEIRRMNQLLAKDNKNLQTNIERITDDRVLSKEMNFEEFGAKYPDKETCYRILAELKWKKEYCCRKCGYDNYCAGKTPYSRRCTKCTYEESVLNNTIFENVRIPINKAFYLVYLVHFHQGEISSYKLSQKLGIRQSTCWNYASKVKSILTTNSKKHKKNEKSGWTKLVLNVLD
ncbi:7TM diverse intracellular signaling domain-containing protein [Sphingobacterium sp. HMA12]|jgi:rubrerythrin|uniref:7TM diverse intracellular signaling domain-containing protein n=1 Tax=Sphingobacterium sp. HMA12 TaxID=2050894 RepID=UPI000CE9E93E|nr:7TM diverse intracellular signaling domain-containing protein [Sphingobacterium sp. HMA12]